MDKETEAADSALRDDDPDVIRGMQRLRELRSIENQITDLDSRR